jgi:flagellar protein FlgJ
MNDPGMSNDAGAQSPMIQMGGQPAVSRSQAAIQPNTDPSQDAQRLRKACRDFESVFLRILLHEMRKGIPEGGVFALSASTGMYREIADDYFAAKLAESGGMGLGDVLYEQLERALAARAYSATAGAGQEQDKPTTGGA